MDHADQRKAKRNLVSKFIRTPLWELSDNTLMSEDFILEFPYAPPGMPTTFRGDDLVLYQHWMRQTVTQWADAVLPIIHDTLDPDCFWIERSVQGKVRWGDCPGAYDNLHISLIQLDGHRVSRFREYVNPAGMYRAAGLSLPRFPYRPKLIKATSLPKSAGRVTRFENAGEITAAHEAIIAHALGPHATDGDDFDTYHENYVEYLPFMPPDMPTRYSPADTLTVRQWITDTYIDWNWAPTTTIYRTPDPTLVLAERQGWGKFRWGENLSGGGYTNKYVILMRVQDGFLKEFREYLNPVNKLLCAGLPIPTFPFMY